MLMDRELTEAIIGAAIQVHRVLGPDLLESTDEECPRHELELRGIQCEMHVPLPVVYKGARLDCGCRIDVLVEGRIVLELKAVDEVVPIHEAQLLTYLRLSGNKIGFLINFNVRVLKDGITRRAL